MTFWILAVVLVLLALAFIVVPMIRPGLGRTPGLIALLAAGVPVVAMLAYRQLGTPEVATQPSPAMPSMQSGALPPGHPVLDVMDMDLGQLAERLARKLEANPHNAEGWALLARTYVELKRYPEALPAFEKAVERLPGDAHLLADYADALAMSQGGRFDPKSEALVERALALEPMHVKALSLKAMAAFHRKDYPAAIASWEQVLRMPGLDAETTQQATIGITMTRQLIQSPRPEG
ncbi:MAG: tetratricopeptide repeat protein [Methylophilaceae bacterium]|nr:tetratricopeptide repeat protein [Methylophilaceae bacterium]